MPSILSRFIRPRRLLPLVEFGFVATGRPWRDFYAWWLDRQERMNSVSKIRRSRPHVEGYKRGFHDLTRGYYHKDFMIRHGLKRTDTVLDFGCGFGRTAIALIPWLEPERYIGVEISKERVRMAKEWIAEEKLEDRKPRFIVSSDINLASQPDDSIDVIWTQAVISHMPLRDVHAFLKAARRILKPDGMMLFDYVVSPEGFKRHTIKDFFYTAETIEDAISEAGLKMEILSDWDDDIEPSQRVENEVLVKATISR